VTQPTTSTEKFFRDKKKIVCAIQRADSLSLSLSLSLCLSFDYRCLRRSTLDILFTAEMLKTDALVVNPEMTRVSEQTDILGKENADEEKKLSRVPSAATNADDDDVIGESAVSEDASDESAIHMIVKDLYVSGISGASELWKIKALSIRHIINCSDKANIFDVKCSVGDGGGGGSGGDNGVGRRFKYMRIVVDDIPHDASKLAAHFDSVSDFIHETLGKGEAILVHCTQGASRSVSLILAYLMKYCDLTLTTALELVRRKRQCGNPNVGFIAKLAEFDEALASFSTKH
jgi:hypothetical protein